MTVDLVPRIKNFSIATKSFSEDSHDIEDGCVSPGSHRLLRFDMDTMNVGDSDAEIGRPQDHPDLFEHSHSHGHQHLRDFNEYELFDASGDKVGVGRKQAFCLMDSGKIQGHPNPAGTARFDCDFQGISRGWYDRYGSHLSCQYLVIDDVPDGKYTLEAKTNAQRALSESCYGNNTTWRGLEIQGNTIQEIPLPWAPKDCISVDPNKVTAKRVTHVGRTSWKVVEQDHWILDFGDDQADAERSAEVIRHYGLSQICFVGRPGCPGQDPMMYWLTPSGGPTGSMEGEDCVEFDPQNLKVRQFGLNWKLVDGSHWLLDFGPSEGNARLARYFIQEHDFTQMCFVGRPNPGMTYFKAEPSLDIRIPRPDFFAPPSDFNVFS